MMLVLMLVWILTVVLLVMVSAVRLSHAPLSGFELRRRSERGEREARAEAHRRELLPYVEALQRIVIALLLVVMAAFAVARFGWGGGILLALLVTLIYGAVARIPAVARQVQHLYGKVEPSLLGFVDKFQPVFRLLRGVSSLSDQEFALASREELDHLVAQSHGILSADEKKLIGASLQFDSRTVEEIMTPRSVIDSIGKKELLGPLVLDDLHKTGHSRFPVIDKDIDHVVGMLYIQDLLTLEGGKHSPTAEKAMAPHVYYVREDQTLAHALAAFLRTHHHLFIVINEYRETVGLLSLEDVIEALLGRKIIDEFDAHDDLRAVAERNLMDNNKPIGHEDV